MAPTMGAAWRGISGRGISGRGGGVLAMAPTIGGVFGGVFLGEMGGRWGVCGGGGTSGDVVWRGGLVSGGMAGADDVIIISIRG